MKPVWVGVTVLSLLGVQAARAQGKPQLMTEMTKEGTKVWAGWKSKEGFRWGWYPQTHVYVKFDEALDDDILTIQHLQGKKPWGKPEICNPKNVYKQDGSKIADFECQGVEAMAINKPGAFGMQLTYKQTAAGKEHKNFGALSYNVIKYKAGPKDVGFIVDYDFQMGAAWINAVLELRGEGEHDPGYPIRSRLMTWWKYEGNEPNPAPKLRCYYKDKMIAEGDGSQLFEHSYDFLAGKNNKKITWAKYGFHLNQLGFEPPSQPVNGVSFGEMFYMNQNPGEYTCKVTYQGNIIRELVFTVGDDGKIVKSKCEQGLVLPGTLSMVKEKVAKGNAKFNAKAFAKSPFYGAKWAAGCPAGI